jgi:hypothetical protein
MNREYEHEAQVRAMMEQTKELQRKYSILAIESISGENPISLESALDLRDELLGLILWSQELSMPFDKEIEPQLKARSRELIASVLRRQLASVANEMISDLAQSLTDQLLRDEAD